MAEHDIVFTDVLGRTDAIELTISLTSDKPVNSRQYPTPCAVQRNTDDEVDRMLESDIEPSKSPYSNPLITVKKKSGSGRVCFDSRKVNKLTVFDSEPMPVQNLITTRVSLGKYFTKMDLFCGYWQIPISKEIKNITTFQTNKLLLSSKSFHLG